MSTYSALIGQTLSERYRIEHEIGKGGQAVVCAGTDTDSGLVRAIKLLPASFNTPPQVIDRFRKESLMLTNLPAHDNVVGVFDGGYDEGLRAFYTIIEFVDGVTLETIIDADGLAAPVAPAEREDTVVHQAEADDDATNAHVVIRERVCTPALAVAVVRQVARGLGHAHGHHFFHRDVKPSNILIGLAGSVNLTDFGIARIAADSGLTMTGVAIGTLHYMSPEQLRDHELDGRSDIYSLGVVLYECLVGHSPFANAERELIPYHTLKTPPTPPTRLNPTISPELEAIVLRALAKEPADRFQTMEKFEGALAQLVDSGITAHLPPAEISSLVSRLRGGTELVQREPADRLDSHQRCANCGAPLPVGWQSALEQCPGCAEPLKETVSRAGTAHELIDQARRKLNVRGKAGFDLAKYIYEQELQGPTFKQWRKAIDDTEPALKRGTVAMPVPDADQKAESDLLTGARRLMAVADTLTDPSLMEYNHRLSELREVEALAAGARGKAYQLLGRQHTRRGAAATAPAVATRHYENAHAAFVMATEQYRLAGDAWRRYGAGNDRFERIEEYYQDVKLQTEQRADWSNRATLITQGILRFPHDRDTAYELFHRAQEGSESLAKSPGSKQDLEVAGEYDDYFEKAVAALDDHQQAIAAAQQEGDRLIAAARQAFAQTLAEDQTLFAEWLRDRSCIALNYFNRREDLPHQMHRMQVVLRLVGYLLLFVLAVAFGAEARHGNYNAANPGPFWPGWPNLLANDLGYALNFGVWHHFLVMLVGIDLLVFWPFTLRGGQRFIGHSPPPQRSTVPMLSSLLIPLVDALHRVAEGLPPASFRRRLLRLGFVVVPWLPVATLGWWHWLNGPAAGNYTWWLLGLAIVPSLAGRLIGRRLRAFYDRLDRLDSDELAAQDELARRVDSKRIGLRAEQKRQRDTVREAFKQVNDNYDHNRTMIDTRLQQLLARLLHYFTEADFVNLPALEQTLLHWRQEMDQRYLRHMGLSYNGPQVVAVKEHTWRLERPHDAIRLSPSAQHVGLRFSHEADGYLLWGIDGFQNGRRERLQATPGGGYQADIKVSLPARQVNFRYETADHRWPAPTYTLWLDEAKQG